MVVEQNVQMVEHVLVKQVGFIQEEDWVKSLVAQLFNVGGDAEEYGGGGGRRFQTQGDAELSVEISAAQGGVVAVREAKALSRQVVAQRTKQTGFAYAWFSDEDN